MCLCACIFWLFLLALISEVDIKWAQEFEIHWNSEITLARCKHQTLQSRSSMHLNMRLGALVPYTRHAHVLCLFFVVYELNDVCQCILRVHYMAFFWYMSVCLKHSVSHIKWVWLFLFYVLYQPSSQPPQYVPPSSKSNRPPFICGLADAEFAAAFVAAVVDADPGEFGAIAAIFHQKHIK